jgi:predicted methyltransferase MtxX (methanogen marker protein 4)
MHLSIVPDDRLEGDVPRLNRSSMLRTDDERDVRFPPCGVDRGAAIRA